VPIRVQVKLRLTRGLDDLPPQTTDDELLEWAAALCAETPPAPVPPPTPIAAKVVPRDASDRLSDEELFADIFERAAAVSGASTG
jgi:hypothetical protein